MFGKKQPEVKEVEKVKVVSFQGQNIVVVPVSSPDVDTWRTLDDLITEGYGVLFTVRYNAYGSSVILQKGAKTQAPTLDNGNITARD